MVQVRMKPVLAIRRIGRNTTQRDYGRDRQCGLVRGAAADPVHRDDMAGNLAGFAAARAMSGWAAWQGE